MAEVLRDIIMDPLAPVLHQVCPDLSPEQLKGDAVWEVVNVLTRLMGTGRSEGWALSAPQVGSNVRVCVFRYAIRGEIHVAANLHVTRTWGERVIREGCLSLPRRVVRVKRSERVSATWLDLKGKFHSVRRATGEFAQILEHEDDHLEGILITERGTG